VLAYRLIHSAGPDAATMINSDMSYLALIVAERDRFEADPYGRTTHVTQMGDAQWAAALKRVMLEVTRQYKAREAGQQP
jgi:hypothetical protein